MRNSFLFLLLFSLLLSCQGPKARRPVRVKTNTSFISTSQELKKLHQIEENRIQQYIKNDSLLSYQVNSRGFWYAYLDQKNQGSQPEKGDVVTYNLVIKDLLNNIIYSEEELGLQTYVVDEEEMIIGLQVGIKLMKLDEKIKFLIPSYNAYGIIGDGSKIGINQSIIVIVTLKEIKSEN